MIIGRGKSSITGHVPWFEGNNTIEESIKIEKEKGKREKNLIIKRT